MTTEWDALPDTIKTFMTALDAREVDQALATLTTDAVVTDEGHDYKGHDEIGAWVATAAAEYTYTTAFTGATVHERQTGTTSTSDSTWRATSRAGSPTCTTASRWTAP